VDHGACVGNGTCLTIAPGVFVHNADRQSEVADPAGDPVAKVLEAAENCPVNPGRGRRDRGALVSLGVRTNR
jgi:ferredoxin